MPTPHINAKDGAFADVVLMPGDPLRAKYIAETFLDGAELVTDVRNMFGYTGEFKGQKVSVMGTGMGIPSASLYSHELIHTFGVRNLIRVGSCGSMQEHVDLYDVVIAQCASTDSNYLSQFSIPGTWAPLSSYRLLEQAKRLADERGATSHVGNVLSSDIFYNADDQTLGKWARMGVLAVEMESAGLFANAAAAGVDALGIFTVSDHIPSGRRTTPAERETAFTTMIEIALEIG